MSIDSLALTDEQRAIQETARRFAADRLVPGYQARCSSVRASNSMLMGSSPRTG